MNPCASGSDVRYPAMGSIHGARPRRVAIPDEAYRIAELFLHQPADPGRRDRCTEPPMLSWSDVAVAASGDSSCSTIEAPTPLDPAQKGTAENE